MTKGDWYKSYLKWYFKDKNFFTWKPKLNFPLEMLVSDTGLEAHFKGITNTPFSSVQRIASAYLLSFMGFLFFTGQALYKEIVSLSCVNLEYKLQSR